MPRDRQQVLVASQDVNLELYKDLIAAVPLFRGVENLKAAERAAGRTSPPDGGGVVDHGPPTPPPSPPWWGEVVRELPADLTC